jgi:hypothetical protein
MGEWEVLRGSGQQATQRSYLLRRKLVGRNLISDLMSESNLKRLCLAVFVSQMPVSFHAQCAAVLMTKPARNRGNIHALLDAAGGKQMAQVVVHDAFGAGELDVEAFEDLENNPF